jgi:phage-related holin
MNDLKCGLEEESKSSKGAAYFFYGVTVVLTILICLLGYEVITAIIEGGFYVKD